jgi:superfamily II DNA/RNA helicase
MSSNNFENFGLSDGLLDSLSMMGYNSPTPVQIQAIPPALEGKDLIACAQTGTGKTAAYVIPAIEKILSSHKKGVKVLVVAPTRELAVQIDQQFQGLGYFSGISSIAVYGGSEAKFWDQQKRALIDGADVVVSTPGRLISHLNMNYVKLDSLEMLVLDEADRMLDMGFVDDIEKIIRYLPKERQTMMYSATMPADIRILAKKILTDPAEINVAIARPSDKVLQAAYLVYDGQKTELIKHLLHNKDIGSVLIFSATKANVKTLAGLLNKMGLKAGQIHSDLPQNEREETLRLFKARKFMILVATDVVSRGIDIDNIELIINYDVPRDAEDYVHRIGRTARAEKSGVAITLINDRDQRDFQKIEKLIEREVFKSPLPAGMDPGPEYKPSKGGGRFKRNYPRKPSGRR